MILFTWPFKLLWWLLDLPAKLLGWFLKESAKALAQALVAIVSAPFKMLFGGGRTRKGTASFGTSKGTASFGTPKPFCPKCDSNKQVNEHSGYHYQSKQKRWYCQRCRHAF